MTKSLRSHALPSRALLLIHDYSRPMTRSNWRKSKPIITTFELYVHVRSIYLYRNAPLNKRVHYIILRNIKQTNWFNIYYKYLM